MPPPEDYEEKRSKEVADERIMAKGERKLRAQSRRKENCCPKKGCCRPSSVKLNAIEETNIKEELGLENPPRILGMPEETLTEGKEFRDKVS